MHRLDLLRSMLLIRAFERRLMSRKDHGFQLLSSGEEAVAVGLCTALRPGDQLLCSGRSIGPALARGLDPALVLAELLGKETGPCHGRGGRGHLAQPSAGFFGAHAVVGGNITIAAGVALALQCEGKGGVAACIIGDGACGAGALHETLNIAALWRLPLLLVCNNNKYSVSTPRSNALAPVLLSDLAKPFGIESLTIDGMDVEAVANAADILTERLRAGNGPAFLECVSDRFSTHSTATRESRPAGELARAWERCPIRHYSELLESRGALGPEGLAELEREIEAQLEKACQAADVADFPDPAELLRDVG
jgi:pyruvate dehydrogenase E1 component alpha subunit